MLLRGPFVGASLVLTVCALASPAQQGYDLNISLEGVKIGPVMQGPAVNLPDLKGQVVMVMSWSMISEQSLTGMTVLTRLHKDLGNYGLTVIGAHSGELKLEELKTKSNSLGIKFTVTDGFFYQSGTVNLPHVYLFNHQGKCIFRGGPSDAERRRARRSAPCWWTWASR